MSTMKKSLSAVTLLTLLLSAPASAAIFDAPDMLKENAGAIGAFGEILLSDPTSEGAELRGRYGISEEWNVGAHLGVGSNGKKLRFGGEGIYNVLPDWEGQVGLSILGGASYIRRFTSGGVQFRVAPVMHKKFLTPWADLPATAYLGVPLVFEARSGNYTTGAQFVLGSLFDLSSASRFYVGGEAGIKIAKSESYILLGVGARLGELRFYKRDQTSGSGSAGGKASGGKEYTDADFR